jgi:hypothetical protein
MYELKNLRKNERKKRLTFNDFFFKYYFSLLVNNLFEKRVLGKTGFKTTRD